MAPSLNALRFVVTGPSRTFIVSGEDEEEEEEEEERGIFRLPGDYQLPVAIPVTKVYLKCFYFHSIRTNEAK